MLNFCNQLKLEMNFDQGFVLTNFSLLTGQRGQGLLTLGTGTGPQKIFWYGTGQNALTWSNPIFNALKYNIL